MATTPTSPPIRLRDVLQGRDKTFQRVYETAIEGALFLCGLFSIVVTILIAIVVLDGTFEFFLLEDSQWMSASEIWARVVEFTTTSIWTAGFNPPHYGIWSLIAGTFMIAVISAAIAMPIGLSTAIFLSEYATPRVREIAKPTLELLAGIPTVVYGFFAITMVTPALHFFIPGVETFNQLSGGIVVGIMILPMIASLSEDALRAVPRSLRDGAYALGATKFETSTKVVVPAALSGITASFILAVSRAVGETMAVSMACGDQARLTWDPRVGLATMTSFIVRVAKGDAVHGTTYFNSLFAVGGMLFFMTLAMNVLGQIFLKKYRQVYQ